MRKFWLSLVLLLFVNAIALAQNVGQPVAGNDISIVKTVDKAFARVGTEVVFTLELRNLGPATTRKVEVEDILPNRFTFISASSLNYDTDLEGDVDYNLKLSEKRAKVSTQYLMSYGIKANRISTDYFGKSAPSFPRSKNAMGG